jgi:hypothetical protein
LKKAFCEPGNVTDNGILSFCRYVIIPVVLRGDPFVVERAPENGGNVEFNNYEVCLKFSKYPNKFPTIVQSTPLYISNSVKRAHVITTVTEKISKKFKVRSDLVAFEANGHPNLSS